MQTQRTIFSQLRLAASTTYPGSSLRSIADRWGALTLVTFQLGRIVQWLRRNRNNALLLDELRDSSRVLVALLRPYVNKKWSVAKRLEALEQHYLALGDKGRLLVFNEEQYLDLIQLGAEYLGLRVVVDRPGWMRSEGEIAVSLFCQNHRIYTAMFLVAGQRGSRRLVVGAIQGWHTPHARQMYVELTHALHGLRPRDFLIDVLKMIAANLACSEILGISDACHRSRHWFSRANKQTAYDAIWLEYGGQLDAEGFFVISAELRQREPTEIPARKRAQYRRRYEFIQNIRRRIDHSFATNERVLKTHRHSARSGESAKP